MEILKTAALGWLITCSLSFDSLASEDPCGGKILKIIATNSVISDVAKRVGGECVHTDSLVEAGTDLHERQTKPSDLRKLASADIILLNGLGLEDSMRGIKESSPDGKTFIVTKGIIPIANSESEDSNREEYESLDHHHHGAIDPHAWNSPSAALMYAKNISDILKTANPAASEIFERGEKDFSDEIAALSQDFRNKISIFPENERTAIATHNAFNYLARDFELKFVTVGKPNEHADLSGKAIANLSDKAKNGGIKILFHCLGDNPREIAMLEKATGAKAAKTTLYADGLTSASNPDGQNYTNYLKHNLNAVYDALKESSSKN